MVKSNSAIRIKSNLQLKPCVHDAGRAQIKWSPEFCATGLGNGNSRKQLCIQQPLNIYELFCGAETFSLGQTGDHSGQPESEQAILDFAGVYEFCVADWLPAGCEIGNQLHPNAMNVAPQPEPQAHAGRAIRLDNKCGFSGTENRKV
ncbi:MAG: hypothetical protein U1D69_07085 [Polynucleobacter sp.]|uniref:hypothetical protein n=1 Tax=Limnobacter sp. TaxID=2003368 RepID=UPI002737224E|nr:hypothetical protein [Limnobacter sp.]MDP3270784.1 hypothetical protein [Limnobacter sp.]MDZ4056720.1 hypothetical protein [Polynucleobacter sp.]